MSVIVVFLAFVIVGDAVAIGIASIIERFSETASRESGWPACGVGVCACGVTTRSAPARSRPVAATRRRVDGMVGIICMGIVRDLITDDDDRAARWRTGRGRCGPRSTGRSGDP